MMDVSNCRLAAALHHGYALYPRSRWSVGQTPDHGAARDRQGPSDLPRAPWSMGTRRASQSKRPIVKPGSGSYTWPECLRPTRPIRAGDVAATLEAHRRKDVPKVCVSDICLDDSIGCQRVTGSGWQTSD